MTSTPDSFQQQLLDWYDRSHRTLPWRTVNAPPPDPYHVWISEIMCQQTQVATVKPYFLQFIKAFPSIQALANASEQDVLRLWQGLGYYSRARNLHRAARILTDDFAGQLPQTAAQLQKLPGIGRYTAGAISSIAFAQRAPILDGNITRVLCRIDAIKTDPRTRDIQKYLWQRAQNLLPHTRIGDFNSALMELGATICTPRKPQCEICPIRTHCKACASGLQELIPPIQRQKTLPIERRYVYCIQNDHRYLIEQRPTTGRWPGMWQFITRPVPPSRQTPAHIHCAIAPTLPTAIRTDSLQKIGQFSHKLTHRHYQFTIYTASVSQSPAKSPRNHPLTWITLNKIHHYPLPRPHQKIVELLQARQK